MRKLSESQKKFLMDAARTYRNALPGSPAEAYLAGRGIPTTTSFGLGYVADPLDGHEGYAGCLAIPYLRYSQWRGWSAVSMRFRRIDGGKPKYLSMPGDSQRLFNTFALLRDTRDVCVTEGELDCVTAELAGLSAVGVPGATMWKSFMGELFEGFRSVTILADGDEPGLQFAREVDKSLSNGRIVQMPDGEDVNSFVLRNGPEELVRMAR